MIEHDDDIGPLDDNDAAIEEHDLEMPDEDVEVVSAEQSNGNQSKERVTSRYLTKYERARILGTRALQLSMGAPPLVDTQGETDALEIAMSELKSKVIPLIIRRYMPSGDYEEWRIDELIIDTL